MVHGMAEFERVYRDLANKQLDIIKKADEGQVCSADVQTTLQEFSYLWHAIQGLPLSAGDHLVLELVVCCSLVQLELLLLLLADSLSPTSHVIHYQHQLIHRYDDVTEVYSAMYNAHSNDFIGQTFSHIYTVVALVECKSASTHEQASEKLELAHKFIDSRSHNSCCDWFHCLLQIKSLLLSDDSSDAVNYYNGWTAGQPISCLQQSTSPLFSNLAHLWDGNCLAEKGTFQLALCKYRQCLLQEGSMCSVPTLSNCALVFKNLNNSVAEMDARTLLLKALDDLERCRHSFAVVWRKDCHISSDSGVHQRPQLRNAVYVTALRALSCKRPKLALSVLEGISDLPSCGVSAELIMLRSLIEVERMAEAIDICLKIVTALKRFCHIVNPERGVQLAEMFLLGAMASFHLRKLDLSNLLAERSVGLCSNVYPRLESTLAQHCSKLMQMSLVVKAVLLIGAGKLASALSCLTCSLAQSSLPIAKYNTTLLKMKISQQSSSLNSENQTHLLLQK